MGIGRLVNALPSPLLVVTDRHQAQAPLEHIVRDAMAGGARWFWLRDRDMERGERRKLALRLTAIVHSAGGRLSIGADIDLAMEAQTGAAHMRDLDGVVRARGALGTTALVGMSAHTIADVSAAKDAGADYVTLSPIHRSASKPGYGPALGNEVIAHAAQIGIPVLALGGMTLAKVPAARDAGAAGIAIMGEAMRAARPAQMARAFLAALTSASAQVS
jgi:thiamine-phosphate pyrophosphorylase